MYAIIEDSGTQIKVRKGEKVEIDLREAKSGDSIVFDRVLLVGEDEGEATIGHPYVKGASVSATVLDTVKGEKLDIVKYRRRKSSKRKVGHRQPYLKVEITGIKA